MDAPYRGDHLSSGMQKLYTLLAKVLPRKLAVITSAAEFRGSYRCLLANLSATIQHVIDSSCFSYSLPDRDHALATSLHSPAPELKTVRAGLFCTNTTALALEYVRHGQSSQSAISATEIVTHGRRTRQIARENSNLKFSGEIHQRMSHSPKASSVANTMAQQRREIPFINPEICKLKKEKPHPEYQLLLFCLAMRFSVSLDK